MSLSIVAAKDLEQAIEILSARPQKAVKDPLADKKIQGFAAALTHVCDIAMEHGYGLAGIRD